MLTCELDVMEYAVTMEEELIEELDDFDDFDDYFDEVGYNPYMGCYDFDCQSKSAPGALCEKINTIVSQQKPPCGNGFYE